MDSFVHAMAMAGVTGAMICGCPLKKHWSEYEERMAPNAISDTDVLQYFSMTDGARASLLCLRCFVASCAAICDTARANAPNSDTARANAPVARRRRVPCDCEACAARAMMRRCDATVSILTRCCCYLWLDLDTARVYCCRARARHRHGALRARVKQAVGRGHVRAVALWLRPDRPPRRRAYHADARFRHRASPRLGRDRRGATMMATATRTAVHDDESDTARVILVPIVFVVLFLFSQLASFGFVVLAWVGLIVPFDSVPRWFLAWGSNQSPLSWRSGVTESNQRRRSRGAQRRHRRRDLPPRRPPTAGNDVLMRSCSAPATSPTLRRLPPRGRAMSRHAASCRSPLRSVLPSGLPTFAVAGAMAWG